MNLESEQENSIGGPLPKATAHISISVRGEQDLDVQRYKLLKLSGVDYKINGMYIEIKGRITRMSKQQESAKNDQAASKKNQIELEEIQYIVIEI